ncbi:MAG: zinc-dependent metalloprotease [Armatimonadetes bacterium]|nr:zinc-dependent metalloprotease [Armatimonadota bacterium]
MKSLWITLALAAVMVAPSPAFARQDEEDDAPPPASAAPQTPPAKPATPEKTEGEKEAEKFAKAIEGLEKTSGEVTLYRRKKEILMELDEAQLGKIFFVQPTISTGVGTDGLQAGDPLGYDGVDVFRFDRGAEDELRLMRPNLDYRWPASDPLALSSSRSFPEAILGNFKIEAKDTARKKLLVNVTRLFDGNLYGLNQVVSMMGGPGFMPDSANSDIASIRAFPENAVIRTRVHFRKSQAGGDDDLGSLLAALFGSSGPPLADGRSLPLTLSFNFWFDRDRGYQPRYADPRVGFFTSDYFDVAKLKQPDRTVRLIQRFHLEKKDPTAAMSEPVKPIVWVLDPSIPEEYRQGVRDGILYWNKTYEAIGYRNAIVVQDAPNTPDYDHADGRFNVVRWTMTKNSAYAVAWFRPNPITGEILNAAVTVDANYPASMFTEFREEVAGGTPRGKWFDENQEQTILRQRVEEPMRKAGFRKVGCNHAEGFCENRSESFMVMKAAGVPVDEKEFVRLAVADLVAHEVGHCLGLRHNFAASTLHDGAALANPAVIDAQAVAASVMDYTPLNLAAVLKGHAKYYNPKIGVYDEWAIAYGYKDFPGTTPDEEKPFLQSHAQRSGSRGLIYLTDDDADGINPLAVRWDLGSDTVEYAKMSLQASELLKQYALTDATKNGQSYTRRNALLLRSLRAGSRAAMTAIRLVGGVEFRRQLKGDVGEVPTLRPVSSAKQRQAMAMILPTVFRASVNDLPQDVLFGMSQDPDAGGDSYNAPLRQFMGTNQRLVLAMLTSYDKLDAIAENAFKTQNPANRYTLAEHYGSITTEVFSEIGKDQAIADLRRDLQRYYLGVLISHSLASGGTINDDARAIVGVTIRQVSKRIKAQLASKNLTDETTKIHLADMDGQIDRFLQRQAMASAN